MATWECANCDHATDNRELAAQHLTECEGVGGYPDELDPLPYIYFRQRYASPVTTAHYLDPRPGYVQDRNAYGA